jgi:hypothetical protein
LRFLGLLRSTTTSATRVTRRMIQQETFQEISQR